MEDDPESAHLYMHDAFLAINQRMQAQDLNDSEREALSVASKYLNLLREAEIAKSA